MCIAVVSRLYYVFLVTLFTPSCTLKPVTPVQVGLSCGFSPQSLLGCGSVDKGCRCSLDVFSCSVCRILRVKNEVSCT